MDEGVGSDYSFVLVVVYFSSVHTMSQEERQPPMASTILFEQFTGDE